MTGTEAKAKFHGCYVATLTPFDTRNRVDTGVVKAHAQSSPVRIVRDS